MAGVICPSPSVLATNRGARAARYKSADVCRDTNNLCAGVSVETTCKKDLILANTQGTAASNCDWTWTYLEIIYVIKSIFGPNKV